MPAMPRPALPRATRAALVALAIVSTHGVLLWGLMAAATQRPRARDDISVLTHWVQPPRPPPPALVTAPVVSLQLRSPPQATVLPLLKIELPPAPSPGSAAAIDAPAGGNVGGRGVERSDMSLEWAPQTSNYYPALARDLHQQGLVLTQVCVGSDGQVSSVRLLRSSAIRRLDQAALAAARATRWRTAMIDRQPMAGCEPFYVKFELSEN